MLFVFKYYSGVFLQLFSSDGRRGSHCPTERKQTRETGRDRVRHNSQRDTLLAYFFLNSLLPLQIAPPGRNHCRSLWEIFHIQTITKQILRVYQIRIRWRRHSIGLLHFSYNLAINLQLFPNVLNVYRTEEDGSLKNIQRSMGLWEWTLKVSEVWKLA